MEEFEFDVSGADVIYTDIKPPPYNPLNRQRPNYAKMIIALGVYLVLGAGLAVGLLRLCGLHPLVTAAAWSVIYFCIIGKRACIWLIRLYQYIAPDRVRLRCVFYPSCSEYMILAIQKYGTLSGIARGIARLRRCHAPNGGEDFP